MEYIIMIIVFIILVEYILYVFSKVYLHNKKFKHKKEDDLEIINLNEESSDFEMADQEIKDQLIKVALFVVMSMHSQGVQKKYDFLLEDITKECEVSEDLIYDYRYIIKHLILCARNFHIVGVGVDKVSITVICKR